MDGGSRSIVIMTSPHPRKTVVHTQATGPQGHSINLKPKKVQSIYSNREFEIHAAWSIGRPERSSEGCVLSVPLRVMRQTPHMVPTLCIDFSTPTTGKSNILQHKRCCFHHKVEKSSQHAPQFLATASRQSQARMSCVSTNADDTDQHCQTRLVQGLCSVARWSTSLVNGLSRYERTIVFIGDWTACQ